MTYEQAEQQGRSIMYDLLHSYYHIEFTNPQFDTVDFRMTALTHPDRTYIGDIKSYNDPNHPRPLSKFDDYMPDYNKLREIKKKALNEGKIPVLYVDFTDCTAVWNLNECDWEKTAEWRPVTKSCVNYGEREWELMVHLRKEDAKIIRYKS